jgi:hypothetical protein
LLGSRWHLSSDESGFGRPFCDQQHHVRGNFGSDLFVSIQENVVLLGSCVGSLVGIEIVQTPLLLILLMKFYSSIIYVYVEEELVVPGAPQVSRS